MTAFDSMMSTQAPLILETSGRSVVYRDPDVDDVTITAIVGNATTRLVEDQDGEERLTRFRDITIALDTVTDPGTHATVVIDSETWSVDAIAKITATMAILNLSRPATAKVTRRGMRT